MNLSPPPLRFLSPLEGDFEFRLGDLLGVFEPLLGVLHRVGVVDRELEAEEGPRIAERLWLCIDWERDWVRLNEVSKGLLLPPSAARLFLSHLKAGPRDKGAVILVACAISFSKLNCCDMV